MLTADELERYARHIVLRDVGGPGQAALKQASALVIGAGAPALTDMAGNATVIFPADGTYKLVATGSYNDIPSPALSVCVDDQFATTCPEEPSWRPGEGRSSGWFIDKALRDGNWALYGEEMLMRTGLYPVNSASQGQILRLSRYRSARIGVDVNLHTGRWTFDEAVRYFMEAGGLDREAATGEAAGAATSPSQKITYITGKWQIMRLLGKYRDQKGKDFRLGQFHDDLIKNGSLPLSIVEWIILNDRSSLDQALK